MMLLYCGWVKQVMIGIVSVMTARVRRARICVDVIKLILPIYTRVVSLRLQLTRRIMIMLTLRLGITQVGGSSSRPKFLVILIPVRPRWRSMTASIRHMRCSLNMEATLDEQGRVFKASATANDVDKFVHKSNKYPQ